MWKCRRENTGVPGTGLQASLQFRHPGSAQPAIDFLVGDIRAGKPRRNLANEGEGVVRTKLPRAAVDH